MDDVECCCWNVNFGDEEEGETTGVESGRVCGYLLQADEGDVADMGIVTV